MSNQTQTLNFTSKAERQAYQEKVKAKIDQLNAQIDQVSAQAREKAADANVNYQKTINELHAQRDALMGKWQDLQQSSEAAWQELQTGLEASWNELVKTFERAQKQF
jgi:Tfp pilus tip-associated adhesin PilY1